jgi:hypothetical protein
MNNTMMKSTAQQYLPILGIHCEEQVHSNQCKNVYRTKIYFKFKLKINPMKWCIKEMIDKVENQLHTETQRQKTIFLPIYILL